MRIDIIADDMEAVSAGINTHIPGLISGMCELGRDDAMRALLPAQLLKEAA